MFLFLGAACYLFYTRYRAIITLARRKSMQRDNNDQIFSKENDFFSSKFIYHYRD